MSPGQIMWGDCGRVHGPAVSRQEQVQDEGSPPVPSTGRTEEIKADTVPGAGRTARSVLAWCFETWHVPGLLCFDLMTEGLVLGQPLVVNRRPVCDADGCVSC